MSNIATILPPARTIFLDSNGDPLVGGEVFFYIPNTDTLKNTWQNSGKTTLNTNPVVLDSLGSAVIYGSGTYRQVVTDVLGNTIWDGLTDGSVEGSTYINVKSVFGAVADGVADDTAAIQAGLNYIEANGGVLYFPTGTYRTTSALSVTFDYTTPSSVKRPSIKGDGAGNSQIVWDGISDPTTYMLTIRRSEVVDGSGLHALSIIEGIGFAPISGAKAYYASGLSLQKWAYLRLSDIAISSLNIGLDLDQIISSEFNSVNVRANNYGIICIGAPASTLSGDIYGANALTFIACEIGNNRYGGMQFTDGNFIFIGGAVEGNGKSGVAGAGYGIKYIRTLNSGGAPMGCKIATYFEANGTSGNLGVNSSTADLWIIHQTTSDNVVYDVNGSVFNQVGSTYAPNGVYVDKQADSALGLSVLGSFMDYGGYVADATRRYISIISTTANRLDNTNKFYSPANYYNQLIQLPAQVAGTGYVPGTTAGVGRIKNYNILVRQSVAQAIPNATATAITWGVAVKNCAGADAVASWTIANPTKIYFPLGTTKIRVSANIRYFSDSVAEANFHLYIMVNGANFYGMPYQQTGASIGAYNKTLNVCSGVIDVTGLPYLEAYTYHNIGAPLNTDFVAFPQATWLNVEIVE